MILSSIYKRWQFVRALLPPILIAKNWLIMLAFGMTSGNFILIFNPISSDAKSIRRRRNAAQAIKEPGQSSLCMRG